MGHFLALIVTAGLILGPTDSQSLSQKRGTLQPDVLITTLPVGELSKHPVSDVLEHDTEVARSESITIVVSIAACDEGERGACNASADVVAYNPDGSVHTEVKNLVLNNRRATVPLPLKASDAPGLYKVIATVRDLNASRFGKAERSFGVKN